MDEVRADLGNFDFDMKLGRQIEVVVRNGSERPRTVIGTFAGAYVQGIAVMTQSEVPRIISWQDFVEIAWPVAEVDSGDVQASLGIPSWV
jgi:hypothetical protein